MTRIPVALVGIGKIARDAHIPALAVSNDFQFAAAVTHHAAPEAAPAFQTITEMMAARPDIAAVSICTPPRGRVELVAEALAHNLHVMIEKPPAATISEAESFVRLARDAGRTLFTTWHSREAAAVTPAREWLRGKHIQRVMVTWKEDVRVWHPGQEWIWDPGIGVFDPGINALSVLTAILPGSLLLEKADLRFPANRAAPIAASLMFAHGAATSVSVEFDFDQRGPQSWDIVIQTSEGQLALSMGASRMAVHGHPVDVGEEPEYHRLYRRFAELIAIGQSDIDLRPFHHVADAFLMGQRTVVAPFEWDS